MNNSNIILDRIDPKLISQECSPRHIQTVLEDLIEIAKAGSDLAYSVSLLNPNCNEIGSGRLMNLLQDAEDVLNKIDS